MNVVVLAENTEWPVVTSKDVECVRFVIAAVVTSTSDLVVCYFAVDFAGSGLGVDSQLVGRIVRPHFVEIVGPIVAEGRWI